MKVSLSSNSITTCSHQHNLNRHTAVSVQNMLNITTILVCTPSQKRTNTHTSVISIIQIEFNGLGFKIKSGGNEADLFYSAEKVLENFSEGRVLIRYRSDSKKIRGGYAPSAWPQHRRLAHLNCLDRSPRVRAWSAA